MVSGNERCFAYCTFVTALVENYAAHFKGLLFCFASQWRVFFDLELMQAKLLFSFFYSAAQPSILTTCYIVFERMFTQHFGTYHLQ